MEKNLKKDYIGLPWWSSGKEPTLQSGGHQFDPWAGKIPYSTGQLSLWPQYWARALEPSSPRARAPHQKSHQNEKPVHHNLKVTPDTATKESSRAAVNTQYGQNR